MDSRVIARPDPCAITMAAAVLDVRQLVHRAHHRLDECEVFARSPRLALIEGTIILGDSRRLALALEAHIASAVRILREALAREGEGSAPPVLTPYSRKG